MELSAFRDCLKLDIYSKLCGNLKIEDYIETYNKNNKTNVLIEDVWHIIEDIFYLDISDLDIFDLDYPCNKEDHTLTLENIKKSFEKTVRNIAVLQEEK